MVVRSVMKVVIVCAGDVEAGSLRRAVEPDAKHGGRALVICADGGALRAEGAGVTPDLILGDGDSLPTSDVERFRARGVDVHLVAPDKEASDSELCLREAIARGASQVAIFGALGGRRPEHSLANVALLALPELAGLDVTLEHGAGRVWLVGTTDGPARVQLSGEATDYISLQPLAQGAEGVTTDGLRFPLRDEPLTYGPSRGLSNEFLTDAAAVSVRRGRLLITHTRRALLEAERGITPEAVP